MRRHVRALGGTTATDFPREEPSSDDSQENGGLEGDKSQRRKRTFITSGVPTEG